MKVSSPIGDLPFEPQRLSVRGTALEVEGVMGAWPARVQVTAADLPALARLVAKPALIILPALAVVAITSRLRRAGH
jgi:hypothetical protein